MIQLFDSLFYEQSMCDLSHQEQEQLWGEKERKLLKLIYGSAVFLNSITLLL